MRPLSTHSVLLSTLLLHSGNRVSGALSPKACAECTPAALESFDYVIVGGGTAGLVLANRLTENTDIKVAVIEAGTSPEDVAGNLTQVPGYAGVLYESATELNLDWGFQVTPQEFLLNKTSTYLRGKTLGGSGVLNFMNYGQTCKGAHQKWADAVDDQSYTYENMLQYYHKAMKFTEPIAGARSANATASLTAADAAINGTLPVTFGAVAWNLYTIKAPEATRATSETAYLHPVLGRSNLAVFDYTFAQRIIFDDHKTATGVEVTSTTTNCSYIISADKEVILSAGVFQSPHLLQVSGVGPKAVLERYNISVVADRPGVGQNMHDETTIFAMYQVDLVTNTRLDQDPEYAAAAVEEYKTNRTGPLTSPGGDLFAFEKIPEEFRSGFSNDTKAYLDELPADWPEIAYIVFPDGATEQEEGANYAILQTLLMASRSVGSVTIKSADMAVAPVINPNWFGSQTDVEVTIAGLRRVRQALNSSAMAPIMIGDELLPGPDVRTDEEIASYVAQQGTTLYHAMASNKMGKTSDPDAVVDNRGRVIGVQRLRVVDGSGFPFLPPGPSPYTQVYVLAEKLADDIKNTIY